MTDLLQTDSSGTAPWRSRAKVPSCLVVGFNTGHWLHIWGPAGQEASLCPQAVLGWWLSNSVCGELLASSHFITHACFSAGDILRRLRATFSGDRYLKSRAHLAVVEEATTGQAHHVTQGWNHWRCLGRPRPDTMSPPWSWPMPIWNNVVLDCLRIALLYTQAYADYNDLMAMTDARMEQCSA